MWVRLDSDKFNLRKWLNLLKLTCANS